MTPEKDNKTEQPSDSRSVLSIDSSAPLKPRSKVFQKLRANKWRLLPVALITVVAIVGLLGFKYFATRNVAAKVGSATITKSEVKKVVEDSKNVVDYKSALELLIDVHKYEQFAVSEDIKLSDEELNNIKLERLRGRAEVFEANSYTKNVILQAAYKRKFEREAEGTAKGVLYYLDTTRYYPSDYQEPVALTGNPRAIEADRVYAQQKAEALRKRVESANGLADTYLAELKADPRLDAVNSDNSSERFGHQSFALRTGTTGGDEVRNAIFKYGRPGITEIHEAKLPRKFGSAAFHNGSLTEAETKDQVIVGYFFVDIHEIMLKRGPEWLNNGLQKIKVVRDG